MPKAASDRVNNEADAPVPPSGWVVYPAVPSVSRNLQNVMSFIPPTLPGAEIDQMLERTESIPGWLNVSERSILYTLGRSTLGPVLELGCFKGKSTSCFLLARARSQFRTTHVVVDVFKDHLDAGRGDFENLFRENVKPFVGATDLRVLRMSTFDAGPALEKIAVEIGGFSGVFVDADHSYPSVLKDGLLAHQLVLPGGWIAFHDAMRWEGSTSVLPACLDIPELNKYRFVGLHSSILLIQKPGAGESFKSWKDHPTIKAFSVWGKTPMASAIEMGTGLIMGSKLGKFFTKARQIVQRANASNS